MQLVSFEGGKLHVSEAALDLLRNVEESVAIISVAGPARSGKSYLLNCLAARHASSISTRHRFTVDSGVHPCTGGLWVWVSSRPTELPDGTKVRLLYVDSEGVGAVKAAEQHDMTLLALTLLISSTFVFNSIGALDEHAISKLAFVTQLSSHVHIQQQGTHDTAQDFERSFPHFIWVLRDFSLQLRDGPDGAALSPKEYLERSVLFSPLREVVCIYYVCGINAWAGHCDRSAVGWTATSRGGNLNPYIHICAIRLYTSLRILTAYWFLSNRIRMLLTTFFPWRDCHTLPRPTVDESALAGLSFTAAQVH